MTQHSSIYIDNDSLIVVEGLKDRDGDPITTATVTLESFLDKNGNAVSGIAVPVLLNHTSGGNYEMLISKDVNIVADRVYAANVKAVASGLEGNWTETVIAKVRRA